MFVFIFSVRSQYWSCRVKVLAGASTGGKEGIWATELVCYLAVECAGVIRPDHRYRRRSSRILETVVQSAFRKISCGLLSVVEVLCKCLFAVKTVFVRVGIAKFRVVLVIWIQRLGISSKPWRVYTSVLPSISATFFEPNIDSEDLY